MDRREQKTKAAIYGAFNSLIRTKRYDKITVQDIIDEANIGRSTFYAHFPTKNDLLHVMCRQTFDHVFAETDAIDGEDSDALLKSLRTKVTHMFQYLKDTQSNIMAVVAVESGELLLSYVREHLENMFHAYMEKASPRAPKDYIIFLLVGSFTDTIRWWVTHGMQQSPEAMTDYYFDAIRGLFANK